MFACQKFYHRNFPFFNVCQHLAPITAIFKSKSFKNPPTPPHPLEKRGQNPPPLLWIYIVSAGTKQKGKADRYIRFYSYLLFRRISATPSREASLVVVLCNVFGNVFESFFPSIFFKSFRFVLNQCVHLMFAPFLGKGALDG